MINLVLDGFEHGSKILEIEAAVLRTMEKSSIRPKEIDTELTNSKIDGFLMMTFVLKEFSAEDFKILEKVFGSDFRFKIIGKSKGELFLELDAPKESFINLGKRYSYQESGSHTQFGSGQSSPHQ